MSATPATIAAVVVATDAVQWMPQLLDSLAAQTRPPDTVVAVDNNSSDGTGELLRRRLGPDGVLPSSRDMGFPAAANMGIAAVPDADYVLILHDDVVLDPTTVERLAEALDTDGRLAVVGPKIVDHDDPSRLLSMGMALDRLGQVHDHVLDQARDQGQGQVGSRHLAVTSATMMARRAVVTQLGGFDQRFEMYRDDLDLCWRVWLAGWEVGVVPTSGVRHRRAGSKHRRDDRTAFVGPHYYRERNTLASIIKNVSGLRVVAAVLGFLVSALVRAVWYVATRRFSDAWQTLEAIGWNIAHLPGTLRRRGLAQRQQRRTQAQIEHLFAGIGPQARHLASIVGETISGQDEQPAPPEDDTRPLSRRVVDTVRRRPGQVTGVVLVAAIVLLGLPALLPGPLRLGEFMPFPESGTAAVTDYLAAWHNEGALATAVDPSPAQFLVGAVQFVLVNSAWAASRFLLLGLPIVAWLLAQVAMRTWAPTRGPRVAAATLYVASPPMVAAVRGGRLSVLVTGAMLPLLVACLATVMRRSDDTAPGWRAAAGAILAGAVMVAFNPITIVGLGVVVWVLAAVAALRRDTNVRRTQVIARLVTIAAGVPLALGPWSLLVLRGQVTVPSGVLPLDAAASPTWQWLVMAPQQFGFPPVLVGAGVAVAALLGIGLATRHHPRTTTVLGLVMVAAIGLAAWLDGRGADAEMWPGTALLFAAGVAAVLFGLGVRHARGVLAGHDFGWRQLVGGVAIAGVVVAVGGTGLDLARDGWALSQDPVQLPEFVTAEANGDTRVLVTASTGDRVEWDLTSTLGPTMAAYGVEVGAATRDEVDGSLSAMIGQSDPSAASLLGLRNVEWVVVPQAGVTEEVEAGFDRQFDLRSETTRQGLVYRLVNTAPEAGLVPGDEIGEIAATGRLPDVVETVALDEVRDGVWRGTTGERPRAVLVGTTESQTWRAWADGVELERRSEGAVAWFDAPPRARITVTAGDRRVRTGGLLVQLVAVAFAVSAVLRPPGSSGRRLGSRDDVVRGAGAAP